MTMTSYFSLMVFLFALSFSRREKVARSAG
jgi:hypothetical protein